MRVIRPRLGILRCGNPACRHSVLAMACPELAVALRRVGISSGSIWGARSPIFLGRSLSTLPNRPSGQDVESLWREFFSDPSQWWDCRANKRNAFYPDFKQIKSEAPLWLNNHLNPSWVGENLQAIPSGSLKQSPFVWNTKLTGCAKNKQYEEVLGLFKEMQAKNVHPDKYTFVSVVNACAWLGRLDEGRGLHDQIMRRGYESDIFVATSLVDMYAKCGNIEEAFSVFNRMLCRNVVSWTAMIVGLVKFGDGQKALALSQQMRNEGIEPNSVTLVAILNACAKVGALEEGRKAHAFVVQRGWDLDPAVASSLVDMYAKCGSIEDAWKVFDKLPRPHVHVWNAMILGLVINGQGLHALDLYDKMRQEQVPPDSVTFLAALKGCAKVAALEKGRLLHKEIMQSDIESRRNYLGSCIVDMYAKCGSIDEARSVFDSMDTQNLPTWSAMLGGYAMHGLADNVFQLFEEMQSKGVGSDKVTFVCLLSACSHAGLVDRGLQCFQSMQSQHNIKASVEHYACVIDLLGRAGRLDEAENMVRTMPCEPSPSIWSSLLGACRIHGNVAMAERIARVVLELDPGDASGYVTLSNIYAAAGKWDCRAKVQRMKVERGARKEPGCTWIEVNGTIHSFLVDGRGHPQRTEIRAEMEKLAALIKEAGYIPDTSFVLQDVDEEEKVRFLWQHSEKLAIVFGLINTPPRTPIRIIKNLRVCGDCHTAIKFIAEITGREIIMRDASRFHVVKDGFCSCRDYW